MFLHLSVSHSVHRVRGGRACQGGGAMRGQGGVCHARPQRYGQSMRGWYASYWNAFLFVVVLLIVLRCLEWTIPWQWLIRWVELNHIIFKYIFVFGIKWESVPNAIFLAELLLCFLTGNFYFGWNLMQTMWGWRAGNLWMTWERDFG